MNFGMITQNNNTTKKAKLCYMDTDSFIIHVKSGDVF